MTEPIGLDHVDVFPDGLCESDGYEGTFCSTRRPYAWSEGTYTFSLTKEETVNFEGKPHTWVAYEIKDWKAPDPTRIGRLLFEGEALPLRNSFAAFVEVYGTQKSVPTVTASFGYPRVDGKELSVTKITAMRPSNAPKVSTVSMKNDVVIVTVNPGKLLPHTYGNDPEIIRLK